MSLQCLELSGEHFVIGVSADEDYVVEFAENGHLISVKSKPCVYTFFYDSSLRLLSEMLVVEDHVILDETVLELSLRIKQVLVTCIIYTISAPVIYWIFSCAFALMVLAA